MPQFRLKIMLVGDTDSGKSAARQRTTQGDFLESQQPNPNIDFALLQPRNDTSERIQIWETPGTTGTKQPDFSYMAGAHAIVIMVDLSTHPTFDAIDRNVNQWLERLKNIHLSAKTTLYFMGTKIDLLSTEALDQAKAALRQVADKNTCLKLTFASSAKQNFCLQLGATPEQDIQTDTVLHSLLHDVKSAQAAPRAPKDSLAHFKARHISRENLVNILNQKPFPMRTSDYRLKQWLQEHSNAHSITGATIYTHITRNQQARLSIWLDTGAPPAGPCSSSLRSIYGQMSAPVAQSSRPTAELEATTNTVKPVDPTQKTLLEEIAEILNIFGGITL